MVGTSGFTITSKSRLVRLDNACIDIHDDEAHTAYYASLGGMIHNFSFVEQTLPWLLKVVSDVDKTIVDAIVYPQRIENGCQTIKRVIKARKLSGSKIEEVLQTLAQLSIISKVRNDLLHLGADVSMQTDTLSVHNRLTAFDPSALRITFLTNKNLMEMQHDLSLMVILWTCYDGMHEAEIPPEHPSYYAAQTAAEVRSFIPLGTKVPWQFKQPKVRTRSN